MSDSLKDKNQVQTKTGKWIHLAVSLLSIMAGYMAGSSGLVGTVGKVVAKICNALTGTGL